MGAEQGARTACHGLHVTLRVPANRVTAQRRCGRIELSKHQKAKNQCKKR
jgi:hypothetical protein